MKKNILLSLLILPVILSGCSSKKPSEAKNSNSKTGFYDTTWQLEYISGPRIAFEGLYPETKPYISFTSTENQFGGNSSCNVYSGKFTLKGNIIHFDNPIKTMMFCEGGGEETFLNMLGKVNKYTIDSEGKLVLLSDDIPMMRFKKIAKPQH